MMPVANPIALPKAQIPLKAVIDNNSPERIAKIQETAKEFEAMFLSLLLKEMRSTLEPEGFFPGDSGDVQGGMFDLYIGQHMANAGGVGFASSIVPLLRGNTYAPSVPSGPPSSLGFVA